MLPSQNHIPILPNELLYKCKLPMPIYILPNATIYYPNTSYNYLMLVQMWFLINVPASRIMTSCSNDAWPQSTASCRCVGNKARNFCKSRCKFTRLASLQSSTKGQDKDRKARYSNKGRLAIELRLTMKLQSTNVLTSARRFIYLRKIFPTENENTNHRHIRQGACNRGDLNDTKWSETACLHSQGKTPCKTGVTRLEITAGGGSRGGEITSRRRHCAKVSPVLNTFAGLDKQPENIRGKREIEHWLITCGSKNGYSKSAKISSERCIKLLLITPRLNNGAK